jgi:subtilisin family serine protease
MSHRRITASICTIGLALAGTIGLRPTDAHAEFIPGITQIVVRIDPAVTSIEQVNAAVGTTVASVSVAANGTYLLDLPLGADQEPIVAGLDTVPGVDYAIPNVSVTPPEIDADRIYAWRIYAWSDASSVPVESAYAVDAVHLDQAHALGSGADVVVAVLDTGVGPHTALGGALLPGIDLVDRGTPATDSANGIDDDGDGTIDEGAGHGTHVAGIVHRVAPDAAILPVRVLDDEGSGTIWNATEGMYIAAAAGADVINMSLGTHGSANSLRVAVEELTARGVLVVAAAGNNGKNRKMFPAAAPAAVAVGSVGRGDVLSSFSNFGRWVDVMAPGEDIHSTFPFPADSWAANSGTSMATPWVSGAAALVLANRPSLSPEDVTATILGAAVPIDDVNVAHAGLLGAGRLDIAKALHAV